MRRGGSCYAAVMLPTVSHVPPSLGRSLTRLYDRGVRLMAKSKGTPPDYDRVQLLEAYLNLMGGLRQIYATTVGVFNTDTSDLTVLRRIDVMQIVAPRLFGAFQQACNLTLLAS